MDLPFNLRNFCVDLTKPAWIVVCRHSRDFHLGQAASVKRQFERQAGGDWDFVCLSDQPSEDWHLLLRTEWHGLARLVNHPGVLPRDRPAAHELARLDTANLVLRLAARTVSHIDF